MEREFVELGLVGRRLARSVNVRLDCDVDKRQSLLGRQSQRNANPNFVNSTLIKLVNQLTRATGLPASQIKSLNTAKLMLM